MTKTWAFDLPRKTIRIRWNGGREHLTVHLHLALPRMTKEGVTKIFVTLRQHISEPGNEELVTVIRDWFYVATDHSLQNYRKARGAYRDEFQTPLGTMPKAVRNKIGANNSRLERELKTAKRVNERLEDRLNLFETMFKGMM